MRNSSSSICCTLGPNGPVAQAANRIVTANRRRISLKTPRAGIRSRWAVDTPCLPKNIRDLAHGGPRAYGSQDNRHERCPRLPCRGPQAVERPPHGSTVAARFHFGEATTLRRGQPGVIRRGNARHRLVGDVLIDSDHDLVAGLGATLLLVRAARDGLLKEAALDGRH